MRHLKYDILVGIDPGTATGFCTYDRATRKIINIETLLIHQCMQKLIDMKTWDYSFYVILEDARQVKFGTDPAKAQGAGSVKRDCRIWIDFLNDLKIPHEVVRPDKRITKVKTELFKKITGYMGKASSHGRDAALLVIGK